VAIPRPKLAKTNDNPETKETSQDRIACEAQMRSDDAQNPRALRAKTISKTPALENTPR
jgi:hypothetical protein